MKERREEKPIDERDMEDWETVAPPSSRTRSVVLSVRFDPDELRAIRDAATRSGVPMGDVVREAVRKYLPSNSSIASTGYSLFATANVLGGSAFVTFGGGRSLDEEEIVAAAEG